MAKKLQNIYLHFYTAKHSNTLRPEIHKEWFSNKERKETLHHYSCPLDCGAREIDDEKYLPKIIVTVLIIGLIITRIMIIMRWWWSYFESM